MLALVDFQDRLEIHKHYKHNDSKLKWMNTTDFQDRLEIHKHYKHNDSKLFVTQVYW